MPIALPPPDPGFEISVATSGMSQGVAQTPGLQVNPRAFVRLGDLQIGGQWRNVSNPAAKGVAAVFVRSGQRFGKSRLDAGVAYRIRTGVQGSADSRAWEFSFGAGANFRRLSLRIDAQYAPKEFQDGRSFYVELGSSLDVDAVTRISASVGRRERDGQDYTSFNAGVGRLLAKGLALDARYYATDRSTAGEQYRARFVVTARLAL